MKIRQQKDEKTVQRRENQRWKKKKMGLAVLRAEESSWSLRRRKQ